MSVGRFVGDLSGWFVIIPRKAGELHSLVLIEVLVNSNCNPLVIPYIDDIIIQILFLALSRAKFFFPESFILRIPIK